MDGEMTPARYQWLVIIIARLIKGCFGGKIKRTAMGWPKNTIRLETTSIQRRSTRV